MKILEALTKTGLCCSQAEAKKLIKSGGCFINNRKILDLDLDIVGENVIIRAGRTKERIINER